MKMISLDDLRAVPILEGLDEEGLNWLAEHFEDVRLEKGDALIVRGEAADRLFVILEGKIQSFVQRDGQESVTFVMEPGQVTGMLPYSRMEVFGVTARAVEPSRVLTLSSSLFEEMGEQIPELERRLVNLMSDRIRDFTRTQEQQEKLVSLGRLAAGLAHELNNPAAAVRRTADELDRRLEALPSLVERLLASGLEAAQLEKIQQQLCAVAPSPTGAYSALEQSEREDALTDWLEDQGVEDGWRLAEGFLEAGLDAEALDAMLAGAPGEAVRPALLAWAETLVTTRNMAGEITRAAERISALVASVKEYTHMDQAQACKPTDVKAGLESTLTMLAHRLKRKHIQVVREYEDVPEIPAYPGELNQVWMNLIDNAVDAMEEGGALRLALRAEPEAVVIEVADDGHGIPADIQEQIFEPFFTTKDVGEGTGLGLDIVHRIIAHRHSGSLDVASEPGRTVFTIRLPRS